MQKSTGFYYYGGKGLVGEGQYTMGEDGNLSIGRGFLGAGTGKGAGEVKCETETLCFFERL